MRDIAKILLFPIALLYGTIIRLRNYLFDIGVLKSTTIKLPVISVGNITVGGTGKTPHIEYLTRFLQEEFKLAILSRGYKRKTRDFQFVETDSSTQIVGDEPLQLKKKFPGSIVAVDRKRVNGAMEIIKIHPDTQLILLDDAFQHRYINPGFSILLIDYNRPINKDYLLPAGRLREHRSAIKRADMVLVTKSPLELSPMNMRIIVKGIPLSPIQHLYFTSFEYGGLRNIFDSTDTGINLQDLQKTDSHVLLITGIAEPGPLKTHLEEFQLQIDHLSYPDHHKFTEKDLISITKKYNSLDADKRCIITTEKDAVRLKEILETDSILPDKKIYSLSINIVFLNDDEQEFKNSIFNYVRKNQANDRIPEFKGHN